MNDLVELAEEEWFDAFKPLPSTQALPLSL